MTSDTTAETNPWTTLSTRETYSNPWIRVREDQVLNPNGGRGIYGVVEFKNRAIGVVPIDDEGFTWLVGQWRYCHERYEWEIPEGGCPAGESTEEVARRELLEETGIAPALVSVIARTDDSSAPTSSGWVKSCQRIASISSRE